MPKAKGCLVCAQLRDEVKFLRKQIEEERAERRRVQAGPPAPTNAGLQIPDPKFIGEHGEPLMEVGGRMVPVEEYERAMRGLDAAMAGRAIETDKEKESIL